MTRVSNRLKSCMNWKGKLRELTGQIVDTVRDMKREDVVRELDEIDKERNLAGIRTETWARERALRVRLESIKAEQHLYGGTI